MHGFGRFCERGTIDRLQPTETDISRQKEDDNFHIGVSHQIKQNQRAPRHKFRHMPATFAQIGLCFHQKAKTGQKRS